MCANRVQVSIPSVCDTSPVMNLRSGCTLDVAVPKVSHHSMELRQNRRSVLAKFYAILHEDTNRWPNEEQACRLSTDTLDPVKFEAHIRYLMTFMVDKDTKTLMEAKANRLVSMATARSLMNVSLGRATCTGQVSRSRPQTDTRVRTTRRGIPVFGG